MKEFLFSFQTKQKEKEEKEMEPKESEGRDGGEMKVRDTLRQNQGHLVPTDEKREKGRHVRP